MNLSVVNNHKITKGFDKILSSKNREGYLQIIEKLTKTKVIVKDNNVILIF